MILIIAAAMVILIAFALGVLFGVFMANHSQEEEENRPNWPRPVDFPPKQ